jgi:conjugal transfer pilus assembly protein TraU
VRSSVRIVLLCAILFLGPCASAAQSRPLNPITDVCWHCVFPIKMGETPLVEGGVTCTTPVIGGGSPICSCPKPTPPFIRTGMSLVYWSPDRYAEVVQNAFSFPSVGANVGPSPNNQSGTSGNGSSDTQDSNFAHVHYFVFPIQEIMRTILDAMCVQSQGFDILYMTEVDPLWNNDQLAALINPEAALFANPATQFSCVADSIVSQGYCPNDAQFWCQGSQGSSYPLTGHHTNEEFSTASAALVGRMLFKLGRQGVLMDPGINICHPVPTPIWVKSNFRLHIALPVRDITCHPIGRAALVWGSGKQIPGKGDGYAVWMIFRKRACCLSGA